MPMKGDDAEVGSGEQQGKDGSNAGRGQRGENGQRMDEALIENAEDNVNGDNRGEDQDTARFFSESWKACAVPWKVAWMALACPLSLGLFERSPLRRLAPRWEQG